MLGFDHSREQKKSLADGINIGALSLGLLGIANSVALAFYIFGLEGVAQTISAISVALFGALFSFSFFLGIAGYWNYDA